MSTRTTEAQGPPSTASPAVVQSVPANAVRDDATHIDLSQTAEVRACVDQLTRLMSIANEAARVADDHAAENPEAAMDAQRARDAADMAATGRNEILAAARSGNRSAVDGAMQRSLSGVRNAVTNATEIIEEHGHATVGDSSRRIAHEVTRQAKASAKTAATKVTTKPTGTGAAQYNARTRQALSGVMVVGARGEDDGDDDAPSTQRRGGLFGVAPVRRETGGAGEGAGATVRRETRRLGSNIRRGGYGLAETVGVLDAQGARTARALEDQAANARTEEEYNAARGERNDAIQRRLLGYTFLDQEIRDALPALERTAVGQQLINSENTFSSSLYTSSVLNRLQANGYITGERGGIWQHSTNGQWSHAAVQRIDRNGDGQLSTQELHYAMTHRYSAPTARPAAASANAASPIAIALGVSRDAALLATPFGRQINELLGSFQNHAGLRQRFDTDRDGRVELHEVIDKLGTYGIRNMRDVDANRDGDITMQEVATALQARARALQQRRT